MKADDLLDKLIDAAKTQVDVRNPELTEAERLSISTQIAVGALRYFMLRFTRNTVIAFDFKDALSFEGETGPYIQYAIVRAANILRKSDTTEEAALAADGRSRSLGAGERRRNCPVGDVACMLEADAYCWSSASRPLSPHILQSTPFSLHNSSTTSTTVTMC